MKRLNWVISLAVAAVFVAFGALADMQGTGQSGGWEKRLPVDPNPERAVEPPGHRVGVFAGGLDPPSAAAVAKEGSLWVAILGQRQAGREPIDQPHVKIFNKNGRGP